MASPGMGGQQDTGGEASGDPSGGQQTAAAATAATLALAEQSLAILSDNKQREELRLKAAQDLNEGLDSAIAFSTAQEIQNKKNPGGFLHQAVDVFLRVLQEMPNQSIAELTGQQIRKLILEMIQRLPQVWPLTQFYFLFPFYYEKSLISLELKSMIPCRGKTELFRSSQQLPRHCLGPLKGAVSAQKARRAQETVKNF